MDVGKYLKRIGMSRPTAPTAEALRTLTRAHLEQVPFENLEPFLEHRCPSLEPGDLFRKVVEEGRGGYCFELNKLFYLLLRELGYDCYCAAARIVYRRTDPRPLSHRTIIVHADGEQWLCDVGFGGPSPKGALLLVPEEQLVEGERFSSREENGTMTLYRHDPDGVHPLMLFQAMPSPDVDFDVLNGYWGYHPDSVFTQKMILYRCISGGILSLREDQYTCTKQEEIVETRKISGVEELSDLLRSSFGLALPRTAG